MHFITIEEAKAELTQYDDADMVAAWVKSYSLGLTLDESIVEFAADYSYNSDDNNYSFEDVKQELNDEIVKYISLAILDRAVDAFVDLDELNLFIQDKIYDGEERLGAYVREALAEDALWA